MNYAIKYFTPWLNLTHIVIIMQSMQNIQMESHPQMPSPSLASQWRRWAELEGSWPRDWGPSRPFLGGWGRQVKHKALFELVSLKFLPFLMFVSFSCHLEGEDLYSDVT